MNWGWITGFNSTLVRLKGSLCHFALSIVDNVSIPHWFD